MSQYMPNVMCKFDENDCRGMCLNDSWLYRIYSMSVCKKLMLLPEDIAATGEVV